VINSEWMTLISIICFVGAVIAAYYSGYHWGFLTAQGLTDPYGTRYPDDV
jgi:hypothetical protein